jgi:hypothetical protein
MEDSHRELEQKALRNVRALVEKVQHDEASRNKRQMRWLLLISVATALIVGGLGISAWLRTSESNQAQRSSCELEAWNARAAAFEREARQANPGVSARDIQNLLRNERPTLMAEAKAQCGPRSR